MMVSLSLLGNVPLRSWHKAQFTDTTMQKGKYDEVLQDNQSAPGRLHSPVPNQVDFSLKLKLPPDTPLGNNKKAFLGCFRLREQKTIANKEVA
jgi:hypothetical protein